MSENPKVVGGARGTPASLPGGGLASKAGEGLMMTTVQALVNKGATLVAMWIVAQQLGPNEFGMASLVLSVGTYLTLTPPLTVGDVLVANQRHHRGVTRVSLEIAVAVGASCAAITLLSAPFISERFSHYPASTLGLLLAIIAIRPLSEAAIAVPLATLRRHFRYRAIAAVDGSVQLVATGAMVVMAVWGAGPYSLIVPQLAAACARAIAFWIVARSQVHTGRANPRALPVVRRVLWGQFMLASIAQYTHNVVVMLPVLVLGYRSSEVETGLYALASTLSSQANTLVAAQLGTVLQPIFGHLDATRGRQFAGFTRVLRTIGVIAVPITLIQAASAGPLFQLAFDPSWLGAVTVFAILSVMESFYFATAPTMAVLRAQRRFRTYFFWQVGHFCVAAVLYWIVAPQYGSIGVAGVSLLCWGCSATLAVWLVAPRSGRSASAVTRIFLTPIAITLPCAVCVYWSGQQLQVLGTAGQVMSLAVLSPCALILCFILLRRFQPVAWVDIDNLLVVVRTRLVRK